MRRRAADPARAAQPEPAVDRRGDGRRAAVGRGGGRRGRGDDERPGRVSDSVSDTC